MKTRKMIVSALAITLVAGSSALAYAGQQGGCSAADRADKRVERMTRQLQLDEAQQASVRALFADQADRMQGQPPKRHALLAELDPNAPDYQQQVKQHIVRMQQQLAEKMQAQADFKASLYAILTPEQEQKLAEMRDHRGDRHDHKGQGHHRDGGHERW
ncbi:Spy/CpxP family protein refolding chaperone [Marinobacterium sediminicola]|uniref:LTXXQ motif family protein n=1 Tax=Marinobacterium sediminicola TaxID=518898 RepID=A0ABY1RZ18_9GAMM|nr:Spy/CpxP family protein refolding chaperone [Marinobacterium sediminicola]ULG69148.1 Spy/CpxP family protein refolding chaperone [Marinobacterium sediminicola]SMR73571.1 LTXXQ motif family protein [Marinobacterium sediminicola]